MREDNKVMSDNAKQQSLRLQRPALLELASEIFQQNCTSKPERYRAYQFLPADENTEYIAGVLAGVQYAAALRKESCFEHALGSMSHRCARILLERLDGAQPSLLPSVVMTELDANTRLYGTRIAFSDRPCVIIRDAPADDSVPVPSLSEMLFSIRGITVLQFSGYEVAVHKSAAFKWDEIEPPLMALLSAGVEGL
jgi:hypothetical protein